VGRKYGELAFFYLKLPTVLNVLDLVATHMLSLSSDKIEKTMPMIKYASNVLFIAETDETHR